MKKSKSIGIWLRVSTEDQVNGESLEHHEKRARLYAESKSWTIRDVYRLDAVSGKAVMEHPETVRMLSDVRSGKITGLIFSKLARLARNTKELLEFAEIFRECDADLISLQESIDTSTPAGRLFYTMIAAMAQWEREEIASRTAASVPIRAKLGKPLGGDGTFGYRWKEKKLVIDPQEAPVRKLIYELFLEHRRKKTVANMLNNMGYRTRDGKLFGYSTVYRLLRDPTAKGLRRANFSARSGKHNEKTYFKPPSEWIYIDAPAIVSAEVWDECNRIMDEQLLKNKRPTRRAEHLFTGLVVCKCGGTMAVPSNSPKYICKKCRNKVGKEDLEEIYRAQLKSFLFSDAEISAYFLKADESIKDKDQLLATLRAEGAEVQAEMDRLMQLYLGKELSPESLGSYFRPLEERKRQIVEQIPELQAEVDFLKIQYLSSDEVLHEAKDLHSRWNSLTFPDKRKIVEIITKRVIVDKTDIGITLSYLPTEPKLMAVGHHTGTGSRTSRVSVTVLRAARSSPG